MRDWIGIIIWTVATSVGVGLFIVGWIAVKMYLAAAIGWPERYGFVCRAPAHYKWGCYLDEIWLSPALLKNASPPEIGMFLYLWAYPVMFVGVMLTYAFWRDYKVRRYHKKQIELYSNSSERE